MTEHTFTPVPLPDAVAPARQRHRALIDEAVAWSTGRERRIDPDHVALICAGVEDLTWSEQVSVTRWSRTGVSRLVRSDIPTWCSWHGTLPPATVCEAVWDWLDFLHATGRLDPRSDPVAELHKPLACHAGLDQDGRRLPEGAERQIECECFLPYRETAELLGAIAADCDRTGRAPLDVLRAVAGRPAVPVWSPMGGDGADLWGELDDGSGPPGPWPAEPWPESWPEPWPD